MIRESTQTQQVIRSALARLDASRLVLHCEGESEALSGEGHAVAPHGLGSRAGGPGINRPRLVLPRKIESRCLPLRPHTANAESGKHLSHRVRPNYCSVSHPPASQILEYLIEKAIVCGRTTRLHHVQPLLQLRQSTGARPDMIPNDRPQPPVTTDLPIVERDLSSPPLNQALKGRRAGPTRAILRSGRR